MNKHPLSIGVLFLGLVLCCGCQRGPAPVHDSSVAPEHALKSSAELVESENVVADHKFDTPEACFKLFQRGLVNEDKLIMFRCSSEASRNYLLGTIAFELERYAHASDAPTVSSGCQGILKKHGLFNRDMMGFLQLVDSPIPGGAPLGFMQIGGDIADPIGFLKEALPVLEAIAKLNDTGDDGEESKTKSSQPIKPTFSLEGLVTDGEKAEGSINTGDQTLPIYFRRENESWVVALAKEEPNWRQPIRGRFMFGETQKVEVDAAKAKARTLLPVFWKAVENPAEGEFAFQLLIEVKTNEGSAKVWCSNFKREKSQITATVQLNEDGVSPEVGSQVTFLEDQIQDFHWQRGSKIVGHFIRRVRIRESELERDQELLKRIIDP